MDRQQWREWRALAIRVYREARADSLDVVSAGVAFYAFLALFPALAAVISLWGLVGDPAAARTKILSMTEAMPDETRELLGDQLGQLASSGGETLGLGAVAGLVLALWSASHGVSALIDALNIAYDRQEGRSFVRRTAITLALTLAGVLLVILAIGAVVAVPVIMQRLQLPEELEGLVGWLRWPVLALVVIVSLSLLYRLGPDRQSRRWEWVTWGSVAATVLWMGASMLFSFYVSRFGNYQKVYGSLAAAVILLLWLLVSAFSVILGAEINAQLEHRIRVPLEPPRDEPAAPLD